MGEFNESTPITMLSFSTRLWNALVDRLDCRTLGDVLNVDEDALRGTKSVGVTTVTEWRRFCENARKELAAGTLPAPTPPSLRDFFAAHARHDDLTLPLSVKDCAENLGLDVAEYDAEEHWPKIVARARYRYAAAMLAEREVQRG